MNNLAWFLLLRYDPSVTAAVIVCIDAIILVHDEEEEGYHFGVDYWCVNLCLFFTIFLKQSLVGICWFSLNRGSLFFSILTRTELDIEDEKLQQEIQSIRYKKNRAADLSKVEKIENFKLFVHETKQIETLIDKDEPESKGKYQKKTIKNPVVKDVHKSKQILQRKKIKNPVNEKFQKSKKLNKKKKLKTPRKRPKIVTTGLDRSVTELFQKKKRPTYTKMPSLFHFPNNTHAYPSLEDDRMVHRTQL